MVDFNNKRNIKKGFRNDKVLSREDILDYYFDNTLSHDEQFRKLFDKYVDKYSKYVSSYTDVNREEVDLGDVVNILRDFYKDKKGYNDFLNWMIRNDRIVSEDNRKKINSNKKGYIYYPNVNSENTLIKLAGELEHVREEVLLSDKSDEFRDKYFSFGPLNKVFPKLREKEMAMYLLNDNMFDNKNVIDTLDLDFYIDMVNMDEYVTLDRINTNNIKANSKSLMEVKLESISSGYGEILSSTLLELCDGDFKLSNEIQKDFIVDRGPGYSREILNSIGCDESDLIKNGGKVLRKIRDTK